MMQANNLTGTGVALVTPFLTDGTIDWSGLEKLIRHVTDGGVEYLVVMGTTAENVTLSKEEKQAVFGFVAAHNPGALPLMAGIGGNYTDEVVQSLKNTDLSGYSSVLSVSPYYSKPNQEGIYQHYAAVAQASPLPVLLYNVPGRTGMNVTAATTLRLAREFSNIIGTKEASGNFDQIMQIIKNKPEGFAVVSGDDGITLPMIALGSSGVISVVANAYPRAFSDMVRHSLADDYPAARVLHYKLIDIIHTLFEEGNPSGVKAYLSRMGICGNYFRLPVHPVSDALMERIRGLMG